MSVRITVDADQTVMAMRRLADDQAPFAIAHALTQLAKSAQYAVQERTRSVFSLHTDFIPKGVRIKPARKSDVRTHAVGTSAVYTAEKISGFMPIHEFGGTRTPTAGNGGMRDKGRSIALPAGGLLSMAYKTNTGKTKKRYTPSALLQHYNAHKISGKSSTTKTRRGGRRNPFIIRSTSSGTPMVVRRKKSGSYPLEVLYTFAPSAKIPKRWRFEGTVRQSVMNNYREQFLRSFRAAIATSNS